MGNAGICYLWNSGWYSSYLLCWRFTTVQPGYGDQYNNEAIAGCVMGGTSMAGGLASIGGTVIGVLIISLLQQGILALGFSKDYQFIITGIIVIAAVYADVSARRRKN